MQESQFLERWEHFSRAYSEWAEVQKDLAAKDGKLSVWCQ